MVRSTFGELWRLQAVLRRLPRIPLSQRANGIGQGLRHWRTRELLGSCRFLQRLQPLGSSRSQRHFERIASQPVWLCGDQHLKRRQHLSAAKWRNRSEVPILGAMKCGTVAVLILLSGRALSSACAVSSGSDSPYFERLPPAKTGIVWKHDNAMSARRYLPESMGPGVAIFDYDNDGWMDLYFTNSGPADFFQPDHPLRNALYHNNHDGTFTDVTGKAGVAGRDFGIGVAAGDYDGDGWTDLLVTTYGRLILYHNNHDGTFTDVTSKSGLGEPGLFTSAVFFDYDNNGTLDLYVCHFVKYDKSLEQDCSVNGVHHYCYPKTYEPWPSRQIG